MPPRSPFVHALACRGPRSACQAVVISFSFLFFLFSHHNKQVLTHSTVAMKQRRGESGSRLRGISWGPTGWGRCPSLVKPNSSLSLQKQKSPNSPSPSSRLLSSRSQAIKAAMHGILFSKKIGRLSSTYFAALMFCFYLVFVCTFQIKLRPSLSPVASLQ